VGIRFNMSHKLFEKTEDGGSLVANRAQTDAVPERGREADHSPPTNAEVTFTPPYAFMA
jgi:hypothetical protein